MMQGTVFLPAGLRRVGWRYFVLRWRQSLFMVLGIMLGVAMMVSIDLANASAEEAFVLSSEAVTGKATHQITGGGPGVPEEVYTHLRRKGLEVPLAPVVTRYVSSPRLGDRPMQLLGLDVFADAPFRGYMGEQASGGEQGLIAFLTRPGAVALSEENAARYGLRPGDTFEIELEGRRKEVFLAGIVQPPDDLSRRTMEGLILADIAAAQEVAGREGWLDRIDLILPEDSQALEERIRDLLPEGLQLAPVEARGGAVAEMTEAFRVNLSALSMLALVVGLFLIYNTMTFSVLQRRPLFGTLRCLGVTRGEVFGLVLTEALWVGLLGSLLGVALGIALGRSTVGMVTRTVNDLYFTTTVQAVGIPVGSLIKGGAAGLLATLITAALPAWEAASVPPNTALVRSVLETKVKGLVKWSALGGAGLIGSAVGLFSLPEQSLGLGFGGTFLVLIGFALLSAVLLAALMRAVEPFSRRLVGLIGRLAPRGLVSSLSRTSVAVAALMVAVAVAIGVGLMIDSFRYTVTVWLDQTLQGDVYISAPSFSANASLSEIDLRVVEWIQSQEHLGELYILRSTRVESRSGPVQLSASSNLEVAEERLYAQRIGGSDTVNRALSQGAVLISEPLANRLGLNAGDSLELLTGRGWRSIPIAGVYYDYSSSEGGMLMLLPVYRSLWQDTAVTALALRLPPGMDADLISRQLEEETSSLQRLNIRPNRQLRAEVMQVFERTFAITAALRILALLVAFVGVLGSLLLLQLERQRETGILRALGLTGRQLWGIVMLETGLMGLAAGLLAIPTGYTLALILVYIINLRSFGWTLQMSIQPSVFAQAVGLALLAALLAGVYPAWRISRMPAAEAVRYE